MSIRLLSFILCFSSPPAGADDSFSLLYLGGPGYERLTPDGIRMWVNSMSPAATDPAAFEIRILEPAENTLLPPDLAPPVFAWKDSGGGSCWLLQLELDQGPLVRVVCGEPFWVPDSAVWDRVRKAADQSTVRLSVSAISGWDLRQVGARADSTFSFSSDPVGAPIFYLQLPVPFEFAQAHPKLARWRLGDPASAEPPTVVMENLPVCANCHAFSRDGSVFGMDMDIDGDKGAFLLRATASRMNLRRADFISWNLRPSPPPAKFSFGLFARISPNGRYASATVGETSVFMKLDDPVFSQLFFPATGRIGIFDRTAGLHFDLPGADRADVVQTGAEWSPDGRTLAFSRAAVDPALVEAVHNGQTLAEPTDQSIHELNRRYAFRFDIWTIPFNEGRGGEPRPLAGASTNGMSNFFPRWSPNGRWIIFTQAPTGLVLQPGSRLSIVPADGGEARVLACSLPVMNSWHSWSPNGRWIVFSGKSDHTLTEIYIAHISDCGEASPPVRLFRFNDSGRTAVVPEFVPPGSPLLQRIQLTFASRAAKPPAGRNER
jgi:hypothetical protein